MEANASRRGRPSEIVSPNWRLAPRAAFKTEAEEEHLVQCLKADDQIVLLRPQFLGLGSHAVRTLTPPFLSLESLKTPA